MSATDPAIAERMPVWRALSDFFLDTELQEKDLDRLAAALADSPYSEDKIEEILRFEVTPACKWNMLAIAGEWAGFDDDWLREKITPRLDARPWFRWPVLDVIRGDWRRTKTTLRTLRNQAK